MVHKTQKPQTTETLLLTYLIYHNTSSSSHHKTERKNLKV